MDKPINPIIQVKNLQISFPENGKKKSIINSISFNIENGETLGLVGESGSGKSITALSILGLLDTNAQLQGEIWWEGKNLLKLTEKDYQKIRGAKISMIFQEPMTSLNPVYSCGNQVLEVLKIHRNLKGREATSETIRLFSEVELPNPRRIFEAYPHQLSGGQRQRVMIAMALSSNPTCLIADEPTTALDVTVQKTIIDLLIRLKETRGMSMIFISHDLGLVSQIANHILVMYKGNIVEMGDTLEVFNNPKHPYTRGLLACRPIENQGLFRLPVLMDFMEWNEDGQIKEIPKTVQEIRYELKADPIKEKLRLDHIYSQKPILEVKNLSKTFGSVKAVDSISFEVYPGETIGLVGESGCGKTSLGRSILRLIEPDKGEIYFKGKDLMKCSKKEMRDYRKQMQIIFQDPYSSLNPRQSIGEILMEPLEVFGVGLNQKNRKEMAFDFLKKVQLMPEHFYRYPHEFSGGQRQRIGIARALTLNPEFIICDESVSALDVSVQAQIINLLISLREELKLTLIFISHDLSVIRYISDRIIVMNKGKFEEIGKTEELYLKPKSIYTQKLIEAIPKSPQVYL